MADFNINVTGTIANDAVTNAKLANMAEATLKGRAVGGGTGDPQDLTADQASTLLDSATNAFIRSSQSAQNIADAVAAEATLRNSGDTATLSAAVSHANGKVVDSITDGVTSSAPSQNAVFDALALKADLASPTFTGTPTAPTPTAGDSSTKLATTAFVDAIAQLAPLPTDGTGAALMFDTNYVLNSPGSPSNATVTLDTSNAVENAQVIAFFNHSSEPSWPAGITAVGHWNNSALNVVYFVYKGTSNISATIVSDATVAWTSPTTLKKVSSNVVNSTTTPSTVLSFTLAAGKKYRLHGKFHVSGTATGGVRLGLTGAGITTRDLMCFGPTTSVTAYTTAPINDSATVATAQYAQNTNTSNFWIEFDGTVESTSGGACDIVMQSFTSGQTATVYASGSSATLELE